ncbi:MAG TPA: alpha/beta hydrolase [Candidatus Limnocylindrales bacterium]|nr:alpha/beta hydrolase [Candidatus Limnocylindrales bacterium]
MPIVEAGGLAQHYETEGAGPPMILLHGATSSATEDWSAQRPLFRRGFRLYLVDARGHAGTRWDAAAGWSADLLVDDLVAFADALGLATFHLVGFSMGAMTALRFAVRWPERLRTLLISGIDVEREPRASVARRLMDPVRVERDEPAWAAQLERRHAPVQGKGAWRRLLPAIVRDVASQSLLTPADLGRVRLPTLMVYGDRDVFVPLDHAVALYRLLPEARLLVAPDCGHQVMSSRPGLFNEAAAGFYRATEAVARARAEGRPADAAAPATRGAQRAPVPTAMSQLAASDAVAAGGGPAPRDADWFEERP